MKFKPIKTEIYELWLAGRPVRFIAATLNIEMRVVEEAIAEFESRLREFG